MRVVAFTGIMFGMLLLAFVPAARAEDQAQAQALLKQAIGYADHGDWKDAIPLLDGAHKLARTDPAILYSLGAVHANAGDDVPAMFWLKAYLLAAPDAANRVQIEARIAASETAARAKAQRLYRAAEKLSAADANGVALKEAAAGNVASALTLVGGQNTDALWMAEAEFAMKADDPERAEKALLKVRTPSVLVAARCDGQAAEGAGIVLRRAADDHRWDNLSRAALDDHFFACQFTFQSVCPLLDAEVDRAALAAISDPAVKATAADDYDKSRRRWRQPAQGKTPLEAWLQCAETAQGRYNQMDLDWNLKPKNVENAAKGYGMPVPVVIASLGSRIADGIAEYEAAQRLVAP